MNSLKNNKFESNKKYFTICVYAVCVVAIGCIIVKAIMDWDSTLTTLGQLRQVLSPFLIGALIAYIINPFVNQVLRLLEKLFHGRFSLACKILAILLAYIVVLGFVSIVLFYIIPQLIDTVGDLVNKIPEVYNQFTDFFFNLESRYPHTDFAYINQLLVDMEPDLIQTARSFATDALPKLYAASMSLISWLVNLLISLIVSIYMLTEKDHLRRMVRRLSYAFLKKETALSFLQTCRECERIFSKFIIGKSIDSLIIGILCFLLMNILRLPYALLISVIVGVTNMIPYFGPYIGAIPGALLTLIISPTSCLIYLIMILCLQQFDGLILGPKILGDSTGLRPLWIIFAITIGGKLAGVLGMFLGVPLVAILSHLMGKWIDKLLREKQAPVE
ncbi:MAG: AI-2E family transporter [Lachnospiraceae bacterium]|jgi:predicted PurR-regulated permease PerM|nr:AI-2E family transporter [Lachnospiraceae bacterium]MCI9135307.1 AI-2E family transporter [Lachnospiraceae bacterium]